MKLKIFITICLITFVGLYFLPLQDSSVYIEENTSSHLENENIHEEDMIFSKVKNNIIVIASYPHYISSTIYHSPVMPVLTNPPKFFV